MRADNGDDELSVKRAASLKEWRLQCKHGHQAIACVQGCRRDPILASLTRHGTTVGEEIAKLEGTGWPIEFFDPTANRHEPVTFTQLATMAGLTLLGVFTAYEAIKYRGDLKGIVLHLVRPKDSKKEK